MGGNETEGAGAKLGGCAPRPGPKTATADVRANSVKKGGRGL